MQIDEKLIDKLADLSKLKFDQDSKKEIMHDMNRILELVNKLDELDTTNVEPLVYLTDEINVLREDKVKQEISREDALKNAPKKDSDYFKVPKVLKKS